MTKIAGSGSGSRSISCMDPRIQIQIQIHTKMSWIRNTATEGTLLMFHAAACVLTKNDGNDELDIGLLHAVRDDRLPRRLQVLPILKGNPMRVSRKVIFKGSVPQSRQGSKLFSSVVGIGTPPPPPRWRERGWGSPISDEGTYTVVLFIYMGTVLCGQSHDIFQGRKLTTSSSRQGI
jgi:hypothetical protein